MSDGKDLRDGDYVVVEDRHCFLSGLCTVAVWPHITPVDAGPGLPQGLAQAYAVDLAAQAGTRAWDLTITLPEMLISGRP
jgi:hypothetical protein